MTIKPFRPPVENLCSRLKSPDATCHEKYIYPITDCPNMKAAEGDTSMSYEHYRCKVCGMRDKLDYEEMR
jgi:hypothetical protein